MKPILPLLALAALLPSSIPCAAAAGAVDEGVALLTAGRAAEARQRLEPWVEAHPEDAEAAHYLGRSWLVLRDLEKASDWLEKAAVLAPARADYQLWLARATGRSAAAAGMLRAMGLAKRCREAYERAVTLDPDLLEARSELIQFYLRAPSIMGGGVDKARLQAAEIARRDAAAGAIAHATVALHEKDSAKAIDLLVKAIAKAPSEPRLRLSLGQVYTTEKRWDEAFEAYQAILARDADHRLALYQVGRTGALSGQRLDLAKAALERYLAGTPSDDEPPLANAHYRLGMVHQHQGNKDAARAAYRAALRLDPKLEDAAKALESLG